MTILTAAALLLGQAGAGTPPDAPPSGLLFGYYRMVAFSTRAQDLGCDSRSLDAELDGLRKRLAARWGKQRFTVARPPGAGAGDCSSAVPVYRVNLADFCRDAEAALSASSFPGE